MRVWILKIITEMLEKRSNILNQEVVEILPPLLVLHKFPLFP